MTKNILKTINQKVKMLFSRTIPQFIYNKDEKAKIKTTTKKKTNIKFRKKFHQHILKTFIQKGLT